MAVKAVIDTNVWVSSLLTPTGHPARLRKAFEDGLFHVVISAPMTEELKDVLSRPKIKDRYEITDEDVEELLLLLEDRADEVLVAGDVNIFRDKDDNDVIETAIKGGAAYLVTGDADMKSDSAITSFLSEHVVSLITLSEFLSVIEQA